ncbi:fibronectin type III domain-containing protein [Paraconexibacter algicola]|uniref:Fibronectin type-III domain-containing protein n=1 Tax=Paraconexibacter algicola TaxID=2133960 RepID=A0A2T4UBR2_9ACTN|nr:fibronectin type III domain-containing protein [Paraconexibacter algicola]PTL54347.1 hypothetical protein C7Y72_21665 [Paraconexibacter algicola]
MTSRRPLLRTLAAVVLLLTGLAATVALAAGPPAATTGAATAVGQTSAQVAGTVNPAGVATTYAFEYGTTTGYGTSTSARDAGNGTVDLAVEADLTGLTAGTTYHYRLRATNADGTTVGEDRTFTTDAATPPRPVASTSGASSVTASSARVSASVNPGGARTSVVFEYGTSTAYGSRTAAIDAGTDSAARTISATLSGLAPRRTYNYRVRATNAGGETVGANRTFTTPAPPQAGLSTGSVTDLTPTSAVLNGRVDPNGRRTTAYVEWGTSTRFGRRTPSVDLGSGDGAVPVAIAVPGLTPAVRHYVRFVVTSDGGTRRGATKSFTTPVVPAVASLQLSPDPVTWGSSARVIGTVSGTGTAGARVTLVGTAYPFRDPFARVGELTASATGAFTFTVNPQRTTRYRVRTTIAGRAVESRTVRLSVRPRVGIRVQRRRGGRVRFSGNVAPRGNATVSLQKITRSGRAVTVRRTRTVPAGPRSRYAVTIRAPRTTSRYRIRVVPTTRTLVRGESRVLRVAGR